jgi:hypothetical protein
LAAREGVVEKAARCTALTVGDEMVEASMARYEREIHREHIDCDIAAVSVYLWCQAMDTIAVGSLCFPIAKSGGLRSFAASAHVTRFRLHRRLSERSPLQAPFPTPS